jgi:hypothetical protein
MITPFASKFEQLCHEVTLVATSIMCEHIGLGQASEAGFGPAHV